MIDDSVTNDKWYSSVTVDTVSCDRLVNIIDALFYNSGDCVLSEFKSNSMSTHAIMVVS